MAGATHDSIIADSRYSLFRARLAWGRPGETDVRSAIAACLVLCCFATGPGRAQDYRGTEQFAALALKCVHDEYPNKVGLVYNGDAEVVPPRLRTPAFYGCFDWHSSVHGHWLLARLLRLHPEAPYANDVRAALDQSLTSQNIQGEVQSLSTPNQASYERPYGLAWALALGEELEKFTDPQGKKWAANFAPLAGLAAEKLKSWLPKLYYPIRNGEHTQTAFGLSLALDYARAAGDKSFEDLIVARARFYYGGDVDCPLAYEPSGEDFLSPCLAEAALMARVMPQREFSRWLARFLPRIPKNGGAAWLKIGVVTDRSDPRLAHLDGLNLSRAWMLDKIARALPKADSRRAALSNTARAHADATLPFVTGEHYEGGHWLGTYAIYYLTERGF